MFGTDSISSEEVLAMAPGTSEYDTLEQPSPSCPVRGRLHKSLGYRVQHLMLLSPVLSVL